MDRTKPRVWVADDDTLNLRRLVSERAAPVRSVRRVKSRVQAVLHANLVPKYAGHLFGKGGRDWLSTAPLPKAERDLLARHLDELDWLSAKLEQLDRAMARISLDDARTRKLMTIAGISSVVATAVIAAIGDISRFPTPDRLASYFGLTPRVRQSAGRCGARAASSATIRSRSIPPARITCHGRSRAAWGRLPRMGVTRITGADPLSTRTRSCTRRGPSASASRTAFGLQSRTFGHSIALPPRRPACLPPPPGPASRSTRDRSSTAASVRTDPP